jgi:hypothetical protein
LKLTLYMIVVVLLCYIQTMLLQFDCEENCCLDFLRVISSALFLFF